MRSFWIVTILSIVLGCHAFAGQAAQQDKQPLPPDGRPAAAAPLHRDGFFTFATKTINPKNIDYGELIAERRNALADASVNNSYFWYSAGSTATVLILLFILYVTLLKYYEHRWYAAEVITDLRNSEKLATAKTRQAVAGYKRHMVQCNRVVEAEMAGRALPGGVVDQDMQRTAESLRQKLEIAEGETGRLTDEIRHKETLVADLTKRIDKLEQGDSLAHSQPPPQQAPADLIALVDRLTRQLDTEQRKNGALKGA